MLVTESFPHIRELAVECRSLAILGKQCDAISRLEDALAQVGAHENVDRLVLMTTKAELLFLDCREEEALQVYTEQIDRLLPHVPDEVAIALSYNRSDITMALLRPDDIYGVVDHSQIAKVNLWDYRAFYEVSASAAAGKHFESLPAVWEELLRAYRQGCWQPYRAASRLMAVECLQLGWPHEAVYHAIIAGQTETARQVGEFLLVNGSPENLTKSINVLLDCANLQRHFITGCEIVMRLVDAIPESRIDDVVSWLLTRASILPTTRGNRQAFEYAWKGLVAIAPQLNEPQAHAVFVAATNHAAWHARREHENQVITVRDNMMKAIGQCADRLPHSVLNDAVEKSLPLALERKQDHDYADAVELLCRLAQRGGSDLKEKIRERLYPKGQPLNWVLLQVAPYFDVDLKDTESLSKSAQRVAENVRLQVQRVPPNCGVKPITGSYGYTTIDLGAETLHVHVASAVDVEAIIRHRHELADEGLQPVVDAIVKMVSERENLVSNKVGLIHALVNIGDVCSDETAAKLFRVLSPLAMGDIVEPTYTMSSTEAANPLNPFKMGLGKPSQLRGVALYALACIERDKPGIFGSDVDRIIELGLTDPDSEVRTLSYAAAREKPTLSESEFTALILGTRDSDAEAAHAAFGAIADKSGLELKRPQWRLLVHSVRLATQSRAVKLRRAAAYTCARLISLAPTDRLRDSISDLRDAFLHDTCFSVRRAATFTENA